MSFVTKIKKFSIPIRQFLSKVQKLANQYDSSFFNRCRALLYAIGSSRSGHTSPSTKTKNTSQSTLSSRYGMEESPQIPVPKMKSYSFLGESTIRNCADIYEGRLYVCTYVKTDMYYMHGRANRNGRAALRMYHAQFPD
ncbi:hypothetical protein TNCV_1326901 [Trichonephila clavipes]|nr:hypothetical protein TNCV_1326901 [Trichonephila clavipes]